MKKIFILFLVLAILSACNAQQHLNIEEEDDGSVAIRFKPVSKYLLLPMEDYGTEKKMNVLNGDYDANSFVIRPAQNQIDYWVPLDLSAYNEKTLEILFADLKDHDLFLREIKLSDSFEYNFNEKYRPVYHFTPPYGWMNDPNGMVQYDGEFHLAYQYNPYGTKWQNLSWGHAVSNDLVHWDYKPVALYPDTLGLIFSGSAVVDQNNSSGFQKGVEKTLLAYFTHAGSLGQVQSMAYSNDRGRNWHKYEGNPVLKHETAPDFRDPKVFWHDESKRWIMITAVGQEMEIYSSENGIDWSFESNFGEGQGAHGGVWECPDLFELPVEGELGNRKWILVCSINPGGPSGGSATQYFIGSFDGQKFVNEGNPEEIRWMDWGKDHYATVTWANVPENDGRRIALGWMTNWEYANDVPTKNFRSATTVARELKLKRKEEGVLLTSYPVKELESLRKTKVTHNNIVVSQETEINPMLKENNGAYEIVMRIAPLASSRFGFVLYNTNGDRVDVSLNLHEGKIYMDRTQSGQIDFSDKFAAVTYAPIAPKEEYLFRLLVDKASIELFEGEGETVMTNIVFPNDPYNCIRFYTKDTQFEVEEFLVYKLD